MVRRHSCGTRIQAGFALRGCPEIPFLAWLYPPGTTTTICGVRSDFSPLHLVRGPAVDTVKLAGCNLQPAAPRLPKTLIKQALWETRRVCHGLHRRPPIFGTASYAMLVLGGKRRQLTESLPTFWIAPCARIRRSGFSSPRTGGLIRLRLQK